MSNLRSNFKQSKEVNRGKLQTKRLVIWEKTPLKKKNKVIWEKKVIIDSEYRSMIMNDRGGIYKLNWVQYKSKYIA